MKFVKSLKLLVMLNLIMRFIDFMTNLLHWNSNLEVKKISDNVGLIVLSRYIRINVFAILQNFKLRINLEEFSRTNL